MEVIYRLFNKNEIKGISLILNVFFATLLFLTSCESKRTNNTGMHSNRNGNKMYVLRTCLQASYVGENYIFCDTALKGERSCFVSYKDRRFLKKVKQFIDTSGNIIKIIKYSPEGILSYDRKELLADKALLEINGWKLTNNILKIGTDSVLFPIRGIIVSYDEKDNIYYVQRRNKGAEELFVFEIW